MERLEDSLLPTHIGIESFPAHGTRRPATAEAGALPIAIDGRLRRLEDELRVHRGKWNVRYAWNHVTAE
jgi:hypothetical protein